MEDLVKKQTSKLNYVPETELGDALTG